MSKPTRHARGKRCRRRLAAENLEERKMRTADMGLALEEPPAVIWEVVNPSGQGTVQTSTPLTEACWGDAGRGPWS